MHVSLLYIMVLHSGRYLGSPKLDENRLGDQFFLLSKKIDKENKLCPTLKKGVF